MSECGLIELRKKNLLCGDKVGDLKLCEECVLEKSCWVKFKTSHARTKDNLDFVHSDSWEPARVKSKSGARYFLSMIDDHSRKV